MIIIEKDVENQKFGGKN